LAPQSFAAVTCLSLALSFALEGCGNEYHPEYHPVSVSEISQNLTYPVTVHQGITSAERGPVLVVPAAPVLVQPPPPPAAAPTMPPGEWFRGY
jgi:hypothetical protein